MSDIENIRRDYRRSLGDFEFGMDTKHGRLRIFFTDPEFLDDGTPNHNALAETLELAVKCFKSIHGSKGKTLEEYIASGGK